MTSGVTLVEFGGQTVGVPTGGYYDRFRMNPDLDEVACDPAAGNIDFFRGIPKRLVPSRVGPVWAPNFYYRSSSAQVLFLAPVSRLRAMLPSPLEPLKPVPGYGLVALTFFSYSVCDNDPYDEMSIAIVIRRPGARGPHALELIDAMRRRSFFAHLLALPVTTDIARVRGVHGYQLPKSRADIQMTIDPDVYARIAAPDGSDDLTLRAPLPPIREVRPRSRMATNTMVNLIDGDWHQASVQSNTLAFAQRLFPRTVTLRRNGGPMSQLLDALGASTIVRLDVVRDAQMVLNMPTRLADFDREKRS